MLDFDEWIRLLFGVRWTGNAESVITLFADDDAHAVQLYFDLFDDFVMWRLTPEARSATPLRGNFPTTDKWPRSYTLDRLLTELRERPAMYLGEPLLSRLMAYLRGFVGAEHDMGMKEHKKLFDDFDRWVRRRYRTDVKHDAESLIVFHHFGDHVSVEPFWKLFDEFTRKGR